MKVLFEIGNRLHRETAEVELIGIPLRYKDAKTRFAHSKVHTLRYGGIRVLEANFSHQSAHEIPRNHATIYQSNDFMICKCKRRGPPCSPHYCFRFPLLLVRHGNVRTTTATIAELE